MRRPFTTRTVVDQLKNHLLHLPPYCRVYRSSNQSIAHNTWTAITFDNERWDYELKNTNGIWDVAAPTRLTIYTPGNYDIGGCIDWASNNTGHRSLRIYLNGATVIDAERVGAVQGDVTILDVGTHYQLAANDFVELSVHQTSGGALNVLTAANYSPEFWIARIG